MAPSATSGNATVVPGELAPPAAATAPARRPPSSSAARAARVGAARSSTPRPGPTQFVNAGRVAAGKKPLDPVSHRRGRDRALCVGARRVAREGASERPAARGDADQRRGAHRRGPEARPAGSARGRAPGRGSARGGQPDEGDAQAARPLGLQRGRRRRGEPERWRPDELRLQRQRGSSRRARPISSCGWPTLRRTPSRSRRLASARTNRCSPRR